jgi:hypothetical protein
VDFFKKPAAPSTSDIQPEEKNEKIDEKSDGKKKFFLSETLTLYIHKLSGEAQAHGILSEPRIKDNLNRALRGNY